MHDTGAFTNAGKTSEPRYRGGHGTWKPRATVGAASLLVRQPEALSDPKLGIPCIAIPCH
jgi:hypothetical protein